MDEVGEKLNWLCVNRNNKGVSNYRFNAVAGGIDAAILRDIEEKHYELVERYENEHRLRLIEEGNIAPLRATVEAKDAEIADALDVKNGTGPTALTMVVAERNKLTAESSALREALTEIADMKPREVEYELPDHSECEECKRIQSNKYHPSTCCNDMYRALMERDARHESEYRAQQYRMRHIARAAIDEAKGEA